MDYSACTEREWTALPPLPRMKIRLAVAVSLLLHGAGLAAVAVFFFQPVDKQPANDRRLTVQITQPKKVPDVVREPEPAVAEVEVEVEQGATTDAAVEAEVPELTARPKDVAPKPTPEVVAEPESEVVKGKRIHTMLEEAISETPALTEPPASMVEPTDGGPHGTVFDPRLREKLASLKTYKRSASGEIASYRKSDGSTHVDLGNGKCFEVRDDMAVGGRQIWWHARCSKSDSSDLSWGDSLR
jgi:hypothetical protein